ncbi:MAG: DUF3999 domain-containing protein [Pseudomonadales bacterium]|jgi:hypothetical protein|nr:DUF3999 domain-containing protein [Pseudomonadales bacterium]MBP9034788.1 DUF3999 domain-containing protein [Pseudomonadales bacterium]
MKTLAWTFIALLGAPGHAAEVPAAPLTPQQFAWRFAIEAPQQTPLQRLALDEALYASVARADLGDLRVFNADGEVLEHAIVAPRAPAASAREPVTLRLFPLRGEEPPAAGGSLRIRLDASGALLDLSGASAGAQPVSAYLLDAGTGHAAIATLRLAWGEDAPDFVSTVALESSTDLRAWRTVGTATVASLTHAGQRLARHEIALDTSPDRYLRLQWPAGGKGVELSGASALPQERTEPQARHWTRNVGSVVADAPHAVEFDARGWLPAERLRVAFAEPNSMATLRLLSRPSADAPWRERADALFYRLQVEGTELTSADVPVERRRDRYWRIEARGSNGKAPTLELGWAPDELVFIARGRGPFLLAAGSARIAPAAQPVNRLLADLDDARRESLTGHARLGGRSSLAGPDALRPLPPPVPWQRYLLWALLIGGVLVLLAMAVRLYRQMNAPT